MGHIPVELFFKFAPVVQEEMSLKEKFTDGRRRKTNHKNSPSAFGSGELK